MMFLRCQTQWRRHPRTGLIDSLDYGAVTEVIKFYGPSKKKKLKQILQGIQVMEATILSEVNND